MESGMKLIEVRSPEPAETPTLRRVDAPPGWLDRGWIPGLDGVRAVAILLVIYAHGSFPGHDTVALKTLKGKCGFLGVQLFFVLSGFLITTLMLREVARSGRLNLRGFYLRRVLRIVPAYLAYLAVIAGLQAGGYAELRPVDWAGALTYTSNFVPSPWPVETCHTWSLSVEEHFYLLWPVCVAGLGLAAGRRVAAGCLIGCMLLRWGALVWLSDEAARRIDLWTFTRMDDLAVGCLVAFAVRSADGRRWLDALTRPALLTACLLGVLAVQIGSSRAVGARLFSPPVFAPLLAVTNTLTAGGIALMVWVVVSPTRPRLAGWLESPVLRAVGVGSYSLYLWHPLFCGQGFGAFAVFPLNLIGMGVAAVVSYRLIERPFLRLKDAVRADRSAPPVSARPGLQTRVPTTTSVRNIPG